MGTLDLTTIATIKRVRSPDQLAVLGEDSDAGLVVKSNQFYNKEFFVDRMYAGPDTSVVSQRIRWVFQDFTKEDMPTFDSRSSAKPRDLVVAQGEFLQCGINTAGSGACATVFSTANPLDEVRHKLSRGIRASDTPQVIDIVRHTLRGSNTLDSDETKDYVNAFIGIGSSIIVSENSRDWLLSHAGNNLSTSCEVTP